MRRFLGQHRLSCAALQQQDRVVSSKSVMVLRTLAVKILDSRGSEIRRKVGDRDCKCWQLTAEA